jgi:MFS family permease
VSTQAQAQAAATPQYSERYLWYVVFVLVLASTLSFIDRQILNLMIGPVKRDLGGLTDTQVSLIMGLAFAGFYNVMSYPAGRWADSGNRRNIMAAGIAAWSVMTALCGMAHTYVMLFLARMGVGVGEATLAPAANSMLTDYFPRERLPLAICFVSAAPFLGQGLANMIGGPLIQHLEAQPSVVMPVLGEVYSWQFVFLVVGLPGVLFALLMLTVREPARRGRMSESGKASFAEVWAFVKTRAGFFGLIFAGYLCLSTQGFALFSWIVEFFVRNHGWTKGEIGLTYGAISMVVGFSGSLFGGYVSSRLISRGRPDGTLRMVFFGTLFLGPLAALMTILPDPMMSIYMLVPVTFLMGMPPGLIISALQTIAPNELRGQSVAFYMIVVNFLSYTFAPTLPALMNDYVFGDELALGKSLSVLAVINYTIAAVCIGLGLRYFRRALKTAEAWQEK